MSVMYGGDLLSVDQDDERPMKKKREKKWGSESKVRRRNQVVGQDEIGIRDDERGEINIRRGKRDGVCEKRVEREDLNQIEMLEEKE